MSVWRNNPKNICLRMIRKHGVIDQGETVKDTVKENVHKYSIMFRIMMMLHTIM